MDAFCLRERDLLNRFAMEVSQRQKQGESKEYSFLLVSIVHFLKDISIKLFLSLSLSLLTLSGSLISWLFPVPELSTCRGPGKSFLRSNNIANLHRCRGNCTCGFIKGNSEKQLLTLWKNATDLVVRISKPGAVVQIGAI